MVWVPAENYTLFLVQMQGTELKGNVRVQVHLAEDCLLQFYCIMFEGRTHDEAHTEYVKALRMTKGVAERRARNPNTQ